MADVLPIDNSLHNLGNGILMPALQHRFRVRFPTVMAFKTEDESDVDIIGLQTLSCKFDFVNKTVSVDVEMSVAHPVLQTLIQQLVDSPDTLVVEIMDGSEDVHQTLVVRLTKCIEHNLNFDYAESGAVYHHLKFNYLSFKVIDFQK